MLVYALSGIILVLATALYFSGYSTKKKDDRSTTVPGLSPTNKKEGNLPDIQKIGTITDFLVAMHKKFGPMFSFWYGKELTISLSSPELFKETAHLFDRPINIFSELIPILGEKSIQFSNGPEAKKRRRMQERAFSHDAVVKKISLIQQVATEMLDKWCQMGKRGKDIPIPEQIYSLMLQINSQYAFGEYFKDTASLLQFRKDYDETFRLLSTIPIDGPLEPGSERESKFLRARENMKDVVLEIIKQRKGQEVDPDDKILLDVLTDTYEDDEDLVFIDALTFLIAGFHSPATVLIWTMYFLALHPEVQERCYQEVRSVWKNDTPLTWEVVRKLGYLKQVYQETMRITRTGAFAGRYSTTDMTIGGHFIPKYTPILQSVCVTMRDEGLYANPDKFDPDRFCDRSKIPNMAFEPFGFSGKRKCPGYRLAELESLGFVAIALSKFKIRLAPDQDVKWKYEIFNTQPCDEFWITLETR